MKWNLLVPALLAGAVSAQCPGGYNPGPGPGAGPGPGGPNAPAPPTVGPPVTGGPGAPGNPATSRPATPPARGASSPTTGPRGNLGGVAPGAYPAPTTPPRGPAAAPGAAPTGRGLGGAAGTTTPRGTPLVIERGATSLDRLDCDWDYPVAAAPSDQQTYAVGTLPADEVYAALAEGDPRPLLLLREAFDGEASELLDEATSDERLRLLAQWFHCVKLPRNVLDDNHPFRNALPDGARVMACLADGSKAQAVGDDLTAGDLFGAMRNVLAAAYPGDADRALRSTLMLLAQFDQVDADLLRLEAELERTLDRRGRYSRRIADLKSQLESLRARREALLAQEATVRDLGRARSKGD